MESEMVSHTRIRSPSYPALSLRKAVDAVGKIYEVYRTSPVDREAAAKLMGYSSLSGPASSAVGALRGFGLMMLAGKGTSVVTERAQAILYPENDEERLENLISAANAPPIFREIRKTFEEHDVPPREGVSRLLNRKGLNAKGVKVATRTFIETAEFIREEKQKVSDSASITPNEETVLGISASDPTGQEAIDVGVGDYVQWESQGALRFSEPRRVRQVAEDGDWVFVDGSETGIPMSELILEKAPAPKVIPPTLPLPSAEATEFEWMRNRVGKNTGVRVMVSGDMGPREIQRLIRFLQTQHDFLVEDEALVDEQHA